MKDGIKLSQKQYSTKILETYGMADAKPADTPMFSNSTIEENGVRKDFSYREAVGSRLYLTAKTRPDLSYAVTYSSRKVQNPTNGDVINIKRTLRYLQGTKNLGIVYTKSSDSTILKAYCDADYAGDAESRKSTTGYVVKFRGGPISWASQKQPIVALSSTEAEFISAAYCCKEILYLKRLLEDLTGVPAKAEMHVDNQSAIKLIKAGIFNRRSKHIDVRYHFINEKVKENDINVVYCSTSDQTADIFTKPWNAVKFKTFRDELVR